MPDLAPPTSPELLAALEQEAALSPDQARRAVGALLRFLAPRLPSPLFGQVRAAVAPPPPGDPGGRA